MIWENMTPAPHECRPVVIRGIVCGGPDGRPYCVRCGAPLSLSAPGRDRR